MISKRSDAPKAGAWTRGMFVSPGMGLAGWSRNQRSGAGSAAARGWSMRVVLRRPQLCAAMPPGAARKLAATCRAQWTSNWPQS